MVIFEAIPKITKKKQTIFIINHRLFFIVHSTGIEFLLCVLLLFILAAHYFSMRYFVYTIIIDEKNYKGAHHNKPVKNAPKHVENALGFGHVVFGQLQFNHNIFRRLANLSFLRIVHT